MTKTTETPALSRSTLGWLMLVLGAVVVGMVWWLTPWGAVPGGAPVPIPTEELFTADQIARAEQVSRWRLAWSMSSLLVGLVVVGVLGFSDLGARLVSRLPGPWWLVVPQAVAGVLVLSRLATLPCGAALHRHLREAGLSTQGWRDWLIDVATGELVQIALTSVALLVLMAIARRWVRWWPVVSAATAASLVVGGSFVWPLLIEPVFNDFEPLPPGGIRDAVLAVAKADGVPVDEVLVADASRRTTVLNAYVSGLWGSRRVVLYDTLVQDAPQDEVVAVVAHELAHADRRDVLIGTALGALGAAWGVMAVALLSTSRRNVAQPQAVPWLLAVTTVGMLLSTPMESAISRQIETRADVGALRATGDPAAFERLQVRLAVRSQSDPTPPGWARWWWGTHPTTLERVAIARQLAIEPG